MADAAAQIRRLDSARADFSATLARLTAFDTAHDEAIDTSVASIIADSLNEHLGQDVLVIVR